METWQELKVTVKREGEELVSNLLIELGAQGVAIEDSMDYVGNVDRFGEIFPEVEQQEEIVVTAYYPETVDVAAGDLLKGVEIEADVIVANILADILIHLTEDAYRLVKDEGYLIMSGIIKDKWDMVRQSAESAGFFLETHMVQGEWNTCVFKKTKDISGVIGG